MTIWTDNAAEFATRDRDQAAEHILVSAVREAIAAYRLGHTLARRIPGAADHLREPVYVALCKAARSAERVLGARS